MKTRLSVSFIVASALSFGIGSVVYGAEIAKALAVENQRYGGVNPRYVLAVICVVAASYSFGYLFTKSKRV